MKSTRLLLISLVLAFVGTFCLVNLTGCSSPPSERVVAVNSLQAVGLTAKSAMDASTQLLKQGSITVAQWEKVAAAYDNRFQPAFTVAVVAARSDLSTIASPDLVALALEITNLVTSFQKTP